MEYIEAQKDLESFAVRAAASPILAIDTEFMREKTYYPRLCLLQMATEDEVVIVDPFCVSDLHVLEPLMRNPNVVKLFHSARQDIEILIREVGAAPSPIFDTQVAAALLGQSHQVGFGSLVHTFCGVSLKKADSFTDWSRRPLAKSQLDYAADDVIYLPELYHTMSTMLKDRGRLEWLAPDFAEMSNEKNYESNSRERFRRLKRGNQLSRKQLSAAREVAAWRENEAQRRDIPRKWLLTDEQIVEACRRGTESIDDLFMIRGIRGHLSTRDARAVVELIKKGEALPESEWPEIEHPAASEINVDAPLDLMNAIVRQRAKENDIAMQTLATQNDLVMLARGHVEGSAVMKGWRKAVVGEELMKLLAGDLQLRLDGTSLIIEEHIENADASSLS